MENGKYRDWWSENLPIHIKAYLGEYFYILRNVQRSPYGGLCIRYCTIKHQVAI